MNQIKAGVILNYVVLGLNNLIGLLYIPFMLRMLGQSEYGLYSLVASIIAYLTIMDFGFGNAIIRYTAKFHAEGKQQEQYEMFGMFLVLYSIIGLLSVGAGAALYFNIDSLFGEAMTTYELGRAKLLMIILIFNLAVTFPLSIFGAIITAYEDFVFQKVVQLIRIILNTTIMICLLKMGYKAVAMVVVQTIFNLATLSLNYYYCHYRIGIKIVFKKFRWGFLKEVSIYSFWIFLNAIMDRIYWGTGQFVLGATASTAAVAVFAVAISMEQMYMSFSIAIASVLLPRVTAMVAKHQSDREIFDLFIRTGRIQYIAMAFILSGFILFGRQFIALWVGKSYEDAYIITVMFFVALIIPLIQNVGITILQARSRMRFRSLLYFTIAISSLAFQILLARRYGGIGCAAAISGALLLGQGLIMNIYYQRKQHLNILAFWREIIKMSVVPVIMVVIGYCVLQYVEFPGIMGLIFSITVYSAIYIPAFWFVGMNRYERDLIGQPITRILKQFHFL